MKKTNEKMITRTIKTTTASAFIFNYKTQQTDYATYNIPNSINGVNTALEYTRKHFESEEIRILDILAIATSENLYGVPESVFLEMATILPRRENKEDSEG